MGVKKISEKQTVEPQPTPTLRLRSLLLALLAALFVCILQSLGTFDATETLSYDIRLRLLSQQHHAHPNITIIEINDQSFARMQHSVGSWPWPRSLFAAVIQHTSQAQSITLDLLFSETDQHFIRGDQELAQEVAAYKRIVNSLYLSQGRNTPAPPPAIFTHAALPKNLQLPPQRRHTNSALIPFPQLLTAGGLLGHANNFPDKDGVVRRNPLFIQLNDRTIPSLALSTALLNLNISPKELHYAKGTLHYGNHSIPLDEKGLLRFIPPKQKNGQRYPTYNIADVLLSWNAAAQGKPPLIPREAFKDRIVLIGSSAIGLYADRKITPVDPLMPGIIIHASLTDNLLTQSSVQLFSTPLLYLLIFILALLPLLWRRAQRPLTILGIGLLILTLYITTCLIALYAFTYILPIAAPINACILALLLISGLYWRQERRKRHALEELERAKQTFSDMLVHDLKGQISSILLAADMMNRTHNNTPPKNNMSSIIKSSGARLLTQINALLDIRRIDEGKLHITSQQLDLNTLLQDISKEYQPSAKNIGCTLQTDLHPHSLHAHLDPSLFRRIIENLLWNALHHGKPNKPITLRSRTEKGHAIIQVLNHGRIIPQEEQNTLFLPFVTRTLTTQKSKIVGTGLGLTFCQMATEALGGQIKLYSPRRDAQDGTEFELTFSLETTPLLRGKIVAKQKKP